MSIDEGNYLSEIYLHLARHQRKEDWPYRDLAGSLVSWAKRFNLEFKLQVSELVLKLDKLPVRCVSHFRRGHNAFGLRGEITINTRYCTKQVFGSVLGHLLHEELHAWQEEHGRRSEKEQWHNREYREKAAEVGWSSRQTVRPAMS